MDIKMDQELKNSILKTGTTILGIVCKDGVVMASDRQSTAGTIVMNKNSEKTKQINNYLVISGCGTVSDIQISSNNKTISKFVSKSFIFRNKTTFDDSTTSRIFAWRL